MTSRTLVALGAAMAIAAPATATTVRQMKWHHRIVLVGAPDGRSPTLAVQRRILARWPGARDRDLVLVAVVGDRVEGASDSAAALRRRFDLPRDRFEAVLIGKDGHVAMRSRVAFTADQLRDTIDAMPMRRAGQR